MELPLMKERRKYERFILGLSGKMEVVTLGKQEVIDVVTTDISAGGAFFHSAEPIPEDGQVKLELIVASERLKELTGAQGLIRVEGTVVRSSPKGLAICFQKNHQIITQVGG